MVVFFGSISASDFRGGVGTQLPTLIGFLFCIDHSNIPMKPKSQQRNNDHIRNFFITSFFFIHATCCTKNDIRRNYFFYSRSQCLSMLQTTSVSGFMAWWHSSFAAGIIWPASSVRMHSSSLVIKPPPHVLEHLRIPKLSYWSCSMKNLNKEKKKQ